jgi:hypothetical protein
MGKLAAPLKKWKYRLRRCAAEGRWLRFWSLFRYLESLWKFHPPRRFLNFWYYVYITRFGKYRPLKLDKKINTGVFYPCLARQKEHDVVLKIPHLKKHYSYDLFKGVRQPQRFAAYRTLLLHLSEDALYGKHFPPVLSVRRDGGYMSTFVKGVNLSGVRDSLRRNEPLAAGIDAARLSTALDELLKNLKAVLERDGELKGDWAPHNLIYDPAADVIYNVDLEGMFLYDRGSIEANIDYIAAELGALRTVLEMRQRECPAEQEILMALPIIGSAADASVSYSGSAFFAGYHSLTLGDKCFNGQRNPVARLKDVPYDFTGKVVLDIGCNTGGMLHPLADKIAMGVGVDRNPGAINAANVIRCLNNRDNLHFYTFDLERESLQLLDNYCLGRQVDICFLLSICLWVKNCRQLVAYTAAAADYLLFETNGNPRQQQEQKALIRQFFRQVEMVTPESGDDPHQRNRTLYLCRAPNR